MGITKAIKPIILVKYLTEKEVGLGNEKLTTNNKPPPSKTPKIVLFKLIFLE